MLAGLNFFHRAVVMARQAMNQDDGEDVVVGGRRFLHAGEDGHDVLDRPRPDGDLYPHIEELGHHAAEVARQLHQLHELAAVVRHDEQEGDGPDHHDQDLLHHAEFKGGVVLEQEGNEDEGDAQAQAAELGGKGLRVFLGGHAFVVGLVAAEEEPDDGGDGDQAHIGNAHPEELVADDGVQLFRVHGLAGVHVRIIQVRQDEVFG